MNRAIVSFSFLILCQVTFSGEYTRLVNPFIGTGAVEQSLSGNCYPGATMPFGMVQLSPDTQEAPDWDKASGYDYNDTHCCGFSHTRLSGTGASDLIDLLVMPSTDDNVWSSLNHEKEVAHPGYYSLTLDNGIVAELTATTHTGIHRYSYPANARQRVYINLDHSAAKGSWQRRIIQSQLKVVRSSSLPESAVIEGYRVITGWAKLRRFYFHIEFSKPIKSYSLKDGDHDYGATPVVNGISLNAFLDFEPDGTPLTIKVGVSATSIENARLNMEKEASHWSFDRYVSEADSIWEAFLGRIEVKGEKKDMVKFYTALYHTLIQPNTMSDVNGEYVATDYSTRRMPSGEVYYSTFSLWDTFRAAHPLYTIIAPRQNASFVASMLTHYDSYGYLPIWDLWGQDNYCMIANHAIPVVVDAVLKGEPGIDAEHALEACVSSATTSHPGSPFEIWEQYGFMPENLQSQSVSLTLEQSFDDWCVAQLAAHLKREDIYERFLKRSQFFRNLYNAQNGFFQARLANGEWVIPFDPLRYGANGGNPYTEGNAWQYLWYVPHDIPALIGLMGGAKMFRERLDTFFSLTERSGEKNDNASGFIGQYVHGNEPSHHVVYLYNYVGAPHKTQQLVRQICDQLYNTTSSGYAGNDDCGEMSAWFVFSAMGFYPVNPVGGEYAIGTPLFDKVIVHLPQGKIFEVTRHSAQKKAFKVRKIVLNGKNHNEYTLKHHDIVKGGSLVFYL